MVGLFGIHAGEFESFRGNMGAFLPLFALGSVFCVWLYHLARYLLYGESTCRLLTLPGVPGGSFKADIEVVLPSAPVRPITISLVNCSKIGRSTTTHWAMRERIEPESLPQAAARRYRIPVRLRIPVDPAQVEYNMSYWMPRGQWILTLSGGFPYVRYYAQFLVPIFKTDKAPAAEQA